MERAEVKRPVFGSAWLANTFFAVVLLYFGRPLLVPLLYGVFVAIIIYPLSRRLEKAGLGRILSISLCLLLITVIFAALLAVLLYQYRLFMHDLPLLRMKLQPLIVRLVSFLGEMGIGSGNRAWLLRDLFSAFGGNAGDLLRTGIMGTANAVINLFIIPLYAALFLYYRRRLLDFLVALFGGGRQQLSGVLVKAVVIYGEYIKGMIWVYLIVGVLNSIGLLILGVPYAFLFGMITAVMTIIPYFGIIVSSLLPISIAWINTGSIYYPLGVVAVFSIVQYLEANFIYPYVVGRRVHVNLLASIVSVFAGGLLWGISGLVLFLPLVAVFKIVAAEVPELHPVNLLLSDREEVAEQRE